MENILTLSGDEYADTLVQSCLGLVEQVCLCMQACMCKSTVMGKEWLDHSMF